MLKLAIQIQYVGFEPKALVRLYSFLVVEFTKKPREFTLTISNDAFLSHRARYQDGPDICYLKLQQELAAHANQPPQTHFTITDAELATYREAHSSKSPRRQ